MGNNIALSDIYDKKFYNTRIDSSYKSALKYAKYLTSYYTPHTVIDIGCGRGSWLKAFKQYGAMKLIGIDGPWNNQSHMIDQSIVFHAIDLNVLENIIITERIDLAISLEVAEHLEPESAVTMIDFLTSLSDVVMFGAAFTAQGGENHINEQPHTYWAKLFIERNYSVYDIFRPVFWGDVDIKFWYQQNTFLYVRNNSTAHDLLITKGVRPLKNIAFMDCIHPSLYSLKL